MKKYLIIALILITHTAAFAEEYLDVTAQYTVQVPGDFFHKQGYQVQWWYFTGHLSDGEGREFGYELTFFAVGIQRRDYASHFGVQQIYISHFAISDIEGNTFYFSDDADAGVFDYAGADDKQLRVWVGRNRLHGTFQDMRLMAADGEKSLALRLKPVKPLALNGMNGFSRKSEDSPFTASVYFSYTRMHTEGKLAIGDKVFTVKGESWFDREITTRGLSDKQSGWDWFAVQLDDDREIMISLLRKRDGSIDRYSSGTLVYRDGTFRHLARDGFSVKVLSHYRSKKTGARYPSLWEVSIPSEDLKIRIVPLIEDQEVIARKSTGNYYWEGACRVEGSARGRAYIEMTGY